MASCCGDLSGVPPSCVVWTRPLEDTTGGRESKFHALLTRLFNTHNNPARMSAKQAAKGEDERSGATLPLDVLEHVVSFLPRVDQGKQLVRWLESEGSEERARGREGGLLLWRLARGCYGPTALRWATAAIAQEEGRALRGTDGGSVLAWLAGGSWSCLVLSWRSGGVSTSFHSALLCPALSCSALPSPALLC